jgi:hypothetical protein
MRQGIMTRLRGERGVTTVVVVVSLIGLMAAAVLSLDFGSAWANRRTIITATDASALYAGRVAALATNPAGCDVQYTDWLARNANDITFQNCVLHPDALHPGTGYILVEARKRANAPLGGLFGIGETQPYSLSAVEYGFVPKPEGLRPMAFCLDNPHVQQWIWYQNWKKVQGGGTADPNFGQISEPQYNALKGTLDAGRPPVKGTDWHSPNQPLTDTVFFIPPADGRIDYPQGSAQGGVGGPQDYTSSSYGVVHRMFFTKDDVYESGNCGSQSTGNWGWIDLDGSDNSTNTQGEWVQSGYDGQLGAQDCNADGSTGDPCYGDVGSSGSANDRDLDFLVENQTQFYIPIFQSCCTSSGGTGSQTEFQIWGFLPLILRGYRSSGAQSDRYFDFEFKDVISTGPCCAKTGGLNTPKGIRICEVDHDGSTSDAVIAARCGQ